MTLPTEKFPNDLEIARRAKLRPLPKIAADMGIGEHLLEPYGSDVAKIKLEAIDELADRPKAKYVVVSAITPTPLGEGKTTTTVGLGQATQAIGRARAIRPPQGQVLAGVGDHADSARWGQDDDDRRSRPGDAAHRPIGDHRDPA